MTASGNNQLPSWLTRSEDYRPGPDRGGFVMQNVLQVAGVLARLRLDDGQETRFSPSAPVKLAFGLCCILLTSLAGNYAFVLAMLAGTLVRVALLPGAALRRVAGVSFGAAAVTALLMAPAILLGQTQSVLLVGTKVLVSVGVAMTVALSTPLHQLTAGLRAFRVPNLVIMTLDLTLKSIVTLGTTARQVLDALRLRSVGHNAQKGAAMGGVAGVVLLKANQAAQDTADAMRCRGFEGSYDVPHRRWLRRADLAWAVALAAILALFFYLEGALA